MNQQEFEDTARRYREEMFRLYANQPMMPQPKPMVVPSIAQNPQPAPPIPQPSQPVPPPPQSAPSIPQPPQPAPPMDLPMEPSLPPTAVPSTHTGSIRVKVSTARGARPISGATVIISREMDGKEHLYALQITGESGETGVITLPAPPPSENQMHPAYYGYDIQVYAPGYYRESSMQVPVFPDVLSMQSFDLIPLPAGITDQRVNGDLIFYNHMQNFETGGEAHADR